jgi:2-iminobutanoate/2-iminopropanoate deaminase
MKQPIVTLSAPAAIGPYSQAVKINNMLFVSGQLGVDPVTGAFVSSDVSEQTRQVFNNLCSILTEAGFEWKDVVKTTVYLSDMANFAAMNDVYKSYFKTDYPARSTVAALELPLKALVEIELIAVH